MSAKDWLVPCPGCGESRTADQGHSLCRRCEGYDVPEPKSDADLVGEVASLTAERDQALAALREMRKALARIAEASQADSLTAGWMQDVARAALPEDGKDG